VSIAVSAIWWSAWSSGRLSDGALMRRENGTYLPGHSPGRPTGARNKLAKHVFEHMLAHWLEPAAPGSKLCKGEEALETVYKEDAGLYLRIVSNILPKEFTFDTATHDLDEDQIDELIFRLRERLAEHRKAIPLPTPKIIEAEPNER
jgi:hypothetical protein